MIHAWQTLIATPLWLRLAVVLTVGLLIAFPAALRWVLRTEAGRAVALGVAAIVAICWFRADAFTDGRAAERAVWAKRVQDETLKAVRADLRASTAARDAERRHAGELQAAATRFHEELRDATTSRDRTIADLRAGAVRLRREWTCPTAGSAQAAASGAGADEDARLREQGAADLVRLLDEADAQIRGLQSTVTADRALK